MKLNIESNVLQIVEGFEKQIREQMRKYYESWEKNPASYTQRNRVAGLKQVEKFSYRLIESLIGLATEIFIIFAILTFLFFK